LAHWGECPTCAPSAKEDVVSELLDRIELWSLPAFAVLIAVEFLSYYLEKRRGAEPKRPMVGVGAKDAVTSLSMSGIGGFTGVVNNVVQLPVLLLAGALAPFQWSGAWWLPALILVDFVYYWEHRAHHRIRMFWIGHSVHHSSRHFNQTTALRLAWLMPTDILSSFIFYVPLVLLGMPLWMLFLLQAAVLIYQFPIHTERVGQLPRWIEFVFNTPSHHRVHHGVNNPYLDKNYGGIFIIWDRMFGTYAHETEQVAYGLTKQIDTYNPIKVNYWEMGRVARDVWNAKTWGARANYLLKPPGWSETTATDTRVDHPPVTAHGDGAASTAMMQKAS
jgi:sterol desaturase/sphingolipid hydroxylase (fatty acid hydroxylase superfamily)